MNKAHIVILLTTLCCHACAQGPNEGFILESEANSHLIAHVTAIYPPIAKAAHVQGDVLLHATIDATGKVIAVEVVGGPPMLRQSALEATKQQTYRPFLVNGIPAEVKIVVSVPFSLGIPDATVKSDQAIGQSFFPIDTRCRAALSAQDYATAKSLCADLVAIAARFPDQKSRANEIRGAHESYGRALLFSSEAPAALVEFRAAVAVAEESLTSADVEYGGAYYWKAFGEAASGMTAESDLDFLKAESSIRKAIVNLPEMQKAYSFELASCLAMHSVLASRIGHTDAAVTMQEEALKLNPHSLDGIPKAKP